MTTGLPTTACAAVSYSRAAAVVRSVSSRHKTCPEASCLHRPRFGLPLPPLECSSKLPRGQGELLLVRKRGHEEPTSPERTRATST